MGDRPFDAQYEIGIAVADMGMTRQYALVVAFLDAEDLRDPVQEQSLALMHQPVRLGDVKQTVENVLQHGAVRLARAA